MRAQMRSQRLPLLNKIMQTAPTSSTMPSLKVLKQQKQTTTKASIASAPRHRPPTAIHQLVLLDRHLLRPQETKSKHTPTQTSSSKPSRFNADRLPSTTSGTPRHQQILACETRHAFRAPFSSTPSRNGVDEVSRKSRQPFYKNIYDTNYNITMSALPTFGIVLTRGRHFHCLHLAMSVIALISC